MNLPPALAPWGPYLRDFPFEVGPALGQLAQRMAALIGPGGQAFDQPEGEVDGYDGLTRRGLPERMLLSDWLLAQEVPDEWARRAAEGELGYLQLARRAPQMSKVVAAVFDAGPDVLGAPRLGQIAALLVLARRAHENGAQLLWGIAQQPISSLWHDLSPSGATALLEARGSPAATFDDLEAWREAFGECDELWLVGGNGIGELARGEESHLRFEDPFEAGRTLDVAVHFHRGEVRHARLELPSDSVCIRLLRDPFGAKNEAGAQVRRVKASFAPQSNLVWIGGHTLAARSNSGGILIFRAPSSPRGGVAKPKHYRLPDAARSHFVGSYNGSIVGAQLRGQGDGVWFHNIGGKVQNVGTGFCRMKEEATGDVEAAPVPLRTLWNFAGDKYQPFLLLPNGVLCQPAPHVGWQNDARGELEIVGRDIRAAEGSELGLVALSGSNPARILQLRPDSQASRGFIKNEFLFKHGEVFAAFLGDSGSAGDQEVGAYKMREGWFLKWFETQGERMERVEVAPDETVMGFARRETKRPSPALLVRGAQNRGLTLRGLGWNHPLVSGDAVASAVVSPSTSYIAWVTERELTVYSLTLDVVLARWQWGEAP